MLEYKLTDDHDKRVQSISGIEQREVKNRVVNIQK